ncbi:hypothetical protein BGZ65_002256 [Modicella reniformis]|uniref:Kelch repeat-containing protein n=1 Tax=Modicella reniformis TaxID=1440133 RepID=A0A9P6MIL8_9FUNG|nr:hypothetical protein BGZ65_002256 [Modicella reniformis]
MRFAKLYSIPLTAALVAQAFPQVLAAEPKIPPGAGMSASTFVENQGLYISDGIRSKPDKGVPLYKQFISLNLSTAWESDAPAWTDLIYRETKDEYDGQGTMTITKDGDALIFFDDRIIHNYDIKSKQWIQEYSMNWTSHLFSGGIVTDLDTGLIYGMEGLMGRAKNHEVNPDDPWKFTEFNPVDKSFTSVEKRGPPAALDLISMVYSSVAKRIFGYEPNQLHDNKEALWSYNITSKDWTPVNATGDIPPLRSYPCFVSAYGGKKLILAGGLGIKPIAILNDVYSLDVSTLTWTKLANMPLTVVGHSCAVSGDSFVAMGGLTDWVVANDEGPAILNLTSNTWGKRYTPTPPGQTPSSADRTHLTLSKAVFVALAVSSLITL